MPGRGEDAGGRDREVEREPGTQITARNTANTVCAEESAH
jgi:hypothetical protein